MSVRELISSYSSPIILGLTPYTRTTVSFEGMRPDWPPYFDAERMQKYDDFTALIENRAQDVFASLQLSAGQSDKIAIALALPELLCNVWADAVWSDPPTIEWQSTAIEDRWTVIDEATDFTEALAWESVFGAAGWGTSVLYLRRDEARTERYDTDVVIDEIDPAIFFPVLKRGSAREIDYVVLAWTEDRAAPDAQQSENWQVREQHFVDGGQYRIRREERRERSGLSREDWRFVGEEAPDGVDFLPFVDMHAARWRGRYWGVSELTRAMGQFDEIDNTISNIAEILEYHGKPMLQVPASILYGGVLQKGADRVVGIRRPEEANVSRYITFDGQIDAQLAHLDKQVELTFLTAEVPRTYFGLGTESVPASGVSLKLQLQNYLKKAARWQRRETARLKKLAPMALALDGRIPTEQAMQAIADIKHGSPLPADDEQTVRIVSAAETGGYLSKKSAVRAMQRLGYVDDVDAELADIEAEKEASIAALPAPMQANIGGNSATNPNGGDQAPA